VEIKYKSRKLQKACLQQRKGDAEWGLVQAKRMRQRIKELQACESLADMFLFPGARFHALHHNREGQFAVDLQHPYRLILEPLGDPLAYRPDGGLDLTRITAVRIIEVEDYHGK